MIDRNAGIGGDRRGIAKTRLTAWRVRVDQSDVMPGALQIERAAAADHPGTNNQLLGSVHLLTFGA